MICSFEYAKKARELILNNKSNENNIITQRIGYSTPMKLILDLHIDLAHLALGVNLYKDYKKSTAILNDLSLVLNRVADIAIFLDVELIVDIEEIQTTDPSITLNALFNNVSMLNYKKGIARNKLVNRIAPLFVELVYSLGFTLEDLEERYKTIMEV